MKFRKVSIEDALKDTKQQNINALKFTPEPKAMYNVYFPSVETMSMAKVHEWHAKGKYQSVACSGEKDCPFCEVERAGWEDYRARVKDLIAGLDPDIDKEEIAKRKRSIVPRITSTNKIYMMVAIVTPANKAEGIEESYEIKVISPSQQRLENFKSYAEATAEDGSLFGTTLVFKYSNDTKPADLGKNMLLMPGMPVSDKIKKAVDEEARNFNWEEALSSFYAFREMTAEEVAKAIQSAGYEAVGDDIDDEELPFAVEKPATAAPANTKAEAEAEGAEAEDTEDSSEDGLDDLDDLV